MKALQAAEDAYRSTEPAAARPHLEKALQMDPDLQRALELMGMMTLLEGDIAGSVRFMGSVRSPRTEGTEAGTVLTTLASLGGELPEDPLGSAALLGALGRTFLSKGMLEATAVCFRALISASGGGWQVFSVLGFVYRQMDHLEASLGFYDKAIESGGPIDELLFDRALVLARLGRLDEAAAAIRHFSEGPKGSPQSWNDLGAILEAQGRSKDAMDAYDRSMSMDPNYYIALYSKGKLLQKMGRSEEAREYLQRALDLESRVFDIEDIRSSRESPPEGSVKVKQLMRKVT